MSIHMKKTLIVLSLIAIFISACDSRSEKAADYNDTLIDHQISIIQAFDRLDSSFSEYDAGEMDYSYLMLEAEIKTGLRVLDTLGGFKSDTILSSSALELFEFYEKVADTEYVQLMELLNIPDSLYTSENQSEAFNIHATINNQFKEAHRNFIAAQKQFGKKFNVEFEDPLSEEELPTED